MPFPFAALAASLAPTALKLGANLLRGDRKSPYEKKLSSMADIFEEQSSGPLSETRVFKEGKRELDRSDRQRREQVQSSSATTGATNEARLASMQDANEVYADAFNRLMGRARQYQDRARQRYLQTIGAQEKARQASDQRFQQKVNRFTQPLGAASRAFLLSDIFNSSGPGLGPEAASRASAMADQVRPAAAPRADELIMPNYNF